MVCIQSNPTDFRSVYSCDGSRPPEYYPVAGLAADGEEGTLALALALGIATAVAVGDPGPVRKIAGQLGVAVRAADDPETPVSVGLEASAGKLDDEGAAGAMLTVLSAAM
ncbi:hypothetical protein [Haloquadratum walsbyi]|uniref:Uncharacterized protein n=1 Tax=Haloquadratum walsbyi J07HQW2 TaxID=1238425 RepID=U1PN00_9EURY|nr:hypothetical protein [Haloquadratum walsbyi]ERG93621.1 MAG: hypothetical protein J07HQW2_00054 [Haloquadratum walsbyi J07HQW2]